MFDTEFKKLKTLVEGMNEKLEELVKLNIGKRIDHLESSSKLTNTKLNTLSKDFTTFKNEIKKDKANEEIKLSEFMQNVEAKLSKVDAMPTFDDFKKLSDEIDEKCKIIDEHSKSLNTIDKRSKENLDSIQFIEKKVNTFSSLKLNVKDYEENNKKVNADFEL